MTTGPPVDLAATGFAQPAVGEAPAKRRGNLARYRPSGLVLLHAGALVAAMCTGALLALHLGQDTTFDLLYYHFYNPYAFLHDRLRWDVQPADYGSYLNPLLDVPTYLLIRHTSPRVTGATLGAAQGINLWLVFEISWFLLKDRVASVRWRALLALAAAAGATFGAVLMSEFGLALGDTLSSVPVLGGLLIFLRSARSDLSDRAAFWVRNLGCLVAGLGVGLKLTNASMGIGLVLAAVVFGTSVRRRIMAVVWAAGSLAVGVLITSGYWFVTLWSYRDNPTFPFYNAIFRSPYFPDYNFSDRRWLPKTWIDYFSTPLRMARTSVETSDLPTREPQFAVAFAALLISASVILSQRRARQTLSLTTDRQRATAALVVFYVVSYAVWARQFGYIRYIAPLEALSTLLVLIVAVALVRRVWLVAPIYLAIVIAVAGLTVVPNWGRFPWKSDYFGPALADQLNQVHGTVVIPGRNPIAFLVPYLHPDVRVIRIGGTVELPAMATREYRAFVMSAIRQQERSGSDFYALESPSDALIESANLELIGYRNSWCTTLETNWGGAFDVCSLTKV